jgi:hypothetical protein
MYFQYIFIETNFSATGACPIIASFGKRDAAAVFQARSKDTP